MLQNQGRTISNTAYQLGSLMLELSLASANLVQAARGNSGPLLSAQPGFLTADGSHATISNRVPSISPFLGMGDAGGLGVPQGAGNAPGVRIAWPPQAQGQGQGGPSERSCSISHYPMHVLFC